MQDHFFYLTTGLFFGIIAGISPGPLLPLVVSETLKFGPRAGIKLSLAPLITDIPIVLASFYLIKNYSENDVILAVISGMGALFLLFLSWENIFYKPGSNEKIEKSQRSLQKGVVANLLNPHPYLFWILVGSPLLLNASKISSFAVVLFLSGFYSMLVGSKIIFALLTGRMKNILHEKSFVIAIRILGIALVIFAILLIKETVNYIL